jgi:hypothetical protein
MTYLLLLHQGHAQAAAAVVGEAPVTTHDAKGLFALVVGRAVCIARRSS